MLENYRIRKHLAKDPAHVLINHFFKRYTRHAGSGSVLELGSRSRSGNVRRDLVHKELDYVGFDIVAGDNVDVMGDAHKLSDYFDKDSFDVIFSMSVFEHLAMPWKVALELNKVLKPGGMMLHTTHQTWPLHEEPWDYWRYSKDTWNCIFNRKTGFEVVETQIGEKGTIVPDFSHPAVEGVKVHTAYLMSVVHCKKIGDSTLSWDVDIEDITSQPYPF